VSDTHPWSCPFPEGCNCGLSEKIQNEAKFTALRAHAERLAEALEKIQRQLNLDDEESYASDDPQGAIDSAHADAKAALTLYRAENPKE